MNNKIEDKDRYRAWVQYIKRPTPPSIDSAFDWAWFAQERKIQALQKENKELREIAKQFKETIQPVPEFLTMGDITSHFKEMRWKYVLAIDRLLTEGEE